MPGGGSPRLDIESSDQRLRRSGPLWNTYVRQKRQSRPTEPPRVWLARNCAPSENRKGFNISPPIDTVLSQPTPFLLSLSTRQLNEGIGLATTTYCNNHLPVSLYRHYLCLTCTWRCQWIRPCLVLESRETDMVYVNGTFPKGQ